ncbi:PREDICTED: uncharacterized protein C1orf65 homolog [Elephantulus edwardii]|uniref:uncharacterized protein C1orf65 homolog n=1 Tax=Elephantulus edwardii TaxID=28737 RepID=UPI0003F0B638|nr:PREDICTED: uncharacterized protein C1orf65 homolog [Elephantulus edwardii]
MSALGRCGADLWGPADPVGLERASSTRLGGPRLRREPVLSARVRAPTAESEVYAPWQTLPPRCSPTSLGRHQDASSRWESRSLTDVVTQRTRVRAQKQRPLSLLENAWGEVMAGPQHLGDGGHGLVWQPLQGHQPLPWNDYPPAHGDSPASIPQGTYSFLSETLGAEKAPNVKQWAEPLCRRLGGSSLSSIPTEKSSVLSKVSTQSATVYPPGSGRAELMESLASQYSQLDGSSGPGSSEEVLSQHSQTLKNKLAEAVFSSRDQKIVALVLARLQKAQKMRDLQRQAAVAWEELKRSDQKVQMTLERERRLLLQRSQEQWRQEKEPPTAHLCLEQHIRKERQARSRGTIAGRNQQEGLEHQPSGKPERVLAHAQQEEQCGVQPLKEQPGVQARNCRQLQRRLEQAGRTTHLNAMEDLKKAHESNLTSIVNYQARKVLMDCQAKAEELLRRLSLEQRHHQAHQCLVRERHQELREKDQEARKRVKPQEQRKMYKRMLKELARTKAHKNVKDMVGQIEDLTDLQEKNHILKLKAEKEDKCHIEGIKEAIKKQHQRMEQLSREKVAALEGFQKISNTSLQVRGKGGAQHSSSIERLPWEPQLGAGQGRGSY